MERNTRKSIIQNNNFQTQRMSRGGTSRTKQLLLDQPSSHLYIILSFLSNYFILNRFFFTMKKGT